MPTRVYPRNLYTELQRRWTAPPLDRWPGLDLPEKRVVDELLDVCYHASFLTEEGRPIVFRAALSAADAPVSPQRAGPGPSEPSMRYLLGQPVPFTEGELRRLAPVADPRRVLIAVEQAEGNRLRIYGLIDVGIALWQMARHERVMGTASPEPTPGAPPRAASASTSLPRSTSPASSSHPGGSTADEALDCHTAGECYDLRSRTGALIDHVCTDLGPAAAARTWPGEDGGRPRLSDHPGVVVLWGD